MVPAEGKQRTETRNERRGAAQGFTRQRVSTQRSSNSVMGAVPKDSDKSGMYLHPHGGGVEVWMVKWEGE